MPGIPSKDASFVWGTPRNYALTMNLTTERIESEIKELVGK